MSSGDKAKSDIKEFGWHVILVPEDANGPSFAYSIGLQKTFGHPEIFVMGLKTDLMHHMINGIGERIKTGLRFTVGNRYADILEGFDCQFATVPEKYFPAYFGQAINFYKPKLIPRSAYSFSVLHCVWPDKQGLFPSDPGFPENVRYNQTLNLEGHRTILKTPPTSEGHAHPFSKEEWPFQDAENTAAITTTRVVNDKFPILLVAHDEDGSWQILCGTTNSSKDALIVCLGCAFEKDRSIGELADLSFGWQARRKSPTSPWVREPSPDVRDEKQ